MALPEEKEQHEQFVAELRRYIELQVDYAKISATEKLVVILTSTAVVAVILLLGGIALFYASFALVYVFKLWLGSEILAYLAVSLIVAVILAIVVLSRKKMIINPISRFITKLFLDKK